MKRSVVLKNWNVAFLEHSRVLEEAFTARRIADLALSPCTCIEATVPGSIETDLIKAGKLPADIFFGTNILETQKWESTHLWYFTSFRLQQTDEDAFLHFGGIDTVSEIFVDGALLGKTDNMLIPYDFPLQGLKPGEHELVVHIVPASVAAAQKTLPAECRAQTYNSDSVLLRKAPYMYGWDIMCRSVSAGLWREVCVEYRPKTRIKDHFLYTECLEKDGAMLAAKIAATGSERLTGLTVCIHGQCKDSEFEYDFPLWGSNRMVRFQVDNPYVWNPKNYGEPNLYAVTVTLKKDDAVLDKVYFDFGIRTVELERTSLAGKDGTFRFVVNGKPIFALGTNWVPTSAFPAQHDAYTLRGLQLADDIGCNLIRAWGGNTYPGEIFYNYCDKHGILVWQDFSMACGIYPQDDEFSEKIYAEAASLATRLRNHASLALWSGDNECDSMYLWNRIGVNGKFRTMDDPNNNRITRKTLPAALKAFDNTRPYLPSSPYMDEVAWAKRDTERPAEDHLWGPRDYFKGPYYNGSICHFASETGYHGCVSPASLKKFIPEESLTAWGDGKACTDPFWLCHAASPEVGGKGPWVYRIPVMTRQIERLFGAKERSLDEYALASQISQAEAVKFFIEKFRLGRGYRWGIIWWNIIDGWPQLSDAVVDWYGCKKLAYSYIKRSQTPFTMAFDEPDEAGNVTLYGINDSRESVSVHYTVTDVLTGTVLASGDVTTLPDRNEKAASLPATAGRFLLIEWTGAVNGRNHFVQNIGENLSYDDYCRFMDLTHFSEDKEGF